MARFEKRLEQLSAERLALEAQLAEPGMYEEPAKAELKESLARQAEVLREIQKAEAGWLKATERFEAGCGYFLSFL